MKTNDTQPKTVIFWGAGATAALGIRTTVDQAKFIMHLTGLHSKDKLSLQDRVSKALEPNDIEPWKAALFELITILGDTDKNYDSIDHINPDQLEAMSRNWKHEADEKELKRQIIHLRLIYDWPALKSIVSICPGISRESFKLNDLFNLLDSHSPLGFGVRAPARQCPSNPNHAEEQFFDARRLIGAKNALRLILITLFYIDYQECLRQKPDILEQYFDFAKCFGKRMQRKGLELASDHSLELAHPAFYQGDVGFVSINYDPIALWVQFMANRELNKSPSAPHIGSPAMPLELFHDYGQLIPARRIEAKERHWAWYSMNESATQRLNEKSVSGTRTRLTKLLFPHGCLCWRECPDCRKFSAFYGDQWDRHSTGLLPPPPLLAFDKKPCPTGLDQKEIEDRTIGAIDARACLHCGTLTFSHHTQTVMQSSFKSTPPSFIEEIKRDLRATTMRANHIIFMGYSLPPDDVDYRAFFAASRQRVEKKPDQQVRCTIINLEQNYSDWYGPTELKALMKNLPKDSSNHQLLIAAMDLFGEDSVRFYGGGVPNVFLDGVKATEAKLEYLLNWSSTS